MEALKRKAGWLAVCRGFGAVLNTPDFDDIVEEVLRNDRAGRKASISGSYSNEIARQKKQGMVGCRSSII